MSAYLTVPVDEQSVLRLLTQQHGLQVGDVVGRPEVDFTPATGNTQQTVRVTLEYQLSQDQVDQLIR